MYEAINKGMKVATGDYIAILNSDDYYVDNQVIQNVANSISKLKVNKWGGVYGNLIKVNKNNKKIRSRRGFQITFKELLFSKKLTVVGHASLFLNRECMECIGYYDYEHFNYAADYDYILRCFKKYKFKYINLTIFNFRQHPESITASGNIAKEINSVIQRNGYADYHLFIKSCIYYYIWAKFIIFNFLNLLNKL
jgi:GT2 family glycosyltransferase